LMWQAIRVEVAYHCANSCASCSATETLSWGPKGLLDSQAWRSCEAWRGAKPHKASPVYLSKTCGSHRQNGLKKGDRAASCLA
jgi:hypothetical protein